MGYWLGWQRLRQKSGNCCQSKLAFAGCSSALQPKNKRSSPENGPFGTKQPITQPVTNENIFFGASPKNQSPSPRGYRLTTYSPEAVALVPVGICIFSIVAVRDLYI